MEKHLTTFSHGSRICLGMNLALAELPLIISSLVERYEVEVVDTTAEDMDWEDQFVFRIKDPLNVRLRNRAAE